MKTGLVLVTILFSLSCAAQDSLLTYKKVFAFDSISKEQIYDRAMVWCSKAFKNSNYAVRVSDKQSGIISGKANYLSLYYIPKKKDSTMGLLFSSFEFNWLIEIKDNKLRITLSEIVYEFSNERHPVKIHDEPPIEVFLQRKSKTREEWVIAKRALVRNLDNLFDELKDEVSKKDNDW